VNVGADAAHPARDAIVDHVTGIVVYPLMKRGQWAATTEVKLNYVAPVQTGVVETESTVLAMTNRSAVVRGEIYHQGRLACAAQGTLTIVDPR
jgi:1,4-dihydroxy-2-naphthoyl-CoA hydrolase